MEIAIIGSGLSAWAAYQSLAITVSDSDSITIIDADYRFDSESSKDGLLAGQKAKFGSTHMYESQGSGLHFSAQSNYSMANGGLSTVWGSGIRLWTYDSLRAIPVEPDDLYAASKFLLQRLPYSGNAKTLNIPVIFDIAERSQPPGSDHFNFLFQHIESSNVQIFPTPLAVDVEGDSRCRGCGDCLKGCPYNSIFDAGVAFDFLVAEEKIRRIKGIVWRLMPEDSKVNVQFVNEEGTRCQKGYDSIYLCAGAIGTPAILMRSDLIPNKIEILDSQVFYFIGIQWPRRGERAKTFALSQATMSNETSSENEFTASLYASNTDVRHRISDLIARRLFGLQIHPPKVLDHFLFFGIGFLDSSKSGKILLSTENNESISVRPIVDPTTALEIRKVLRLITKSLFKRGLLVLPWVSVVPQPGAGFHSGAALPVNSQHVDSQGALRGHPSIRISDTSLLPFLKPGAHTFTSMSLSSSLILRK